MKTSLNFAVLVMALAILLSPAAVPALAGTPPAGGYLELPASAHADGAAVVTTRALLAGTQMRSFTYRYDIRNRIALWVAYPLNRGLIGTGSRGEEWTPDPALPERAQPVLYRGFRPTDKRYDRGHQIPSADRLDPEANAQTFRFTNATPQLHDFNGGIWAELEKQVRRWCYLSDTLYVVTGAVPGTDSMPDNAGNPVNVPKAYYKAVLRLHHWKNGQAHWQACAVYIPHREGYPEKGNDFRQWAMSVDDLGRLVGESFFPGLDRILGKDNAAAVRKANPVSDPWWWR